MGHHSTPGIIGPRLPSLYSAFLQDTGLSPAPGASASRLPSLYFASLQGTGLSPAPGIIGPRHPSQYIAALKGFGYKSSPRPSASRLSSTLESKHWTMHSSSVSSEIPGYLIYRNIPYDNGLAIFELLSLERSSHGPHARWATSPGIRVSGYLVNPANHSRVPSKYHNLSRGWDTSPASPAQDHRPQGSHPCTWPHSRGWVTTPPLGSLALGIHLST